jgi:hypothetical protein
MDSSESIRERAATAGWPAELADKLLQARLPTSEHERLLADDAPPLGAIERIVDSAHRLAHGSLRAREVTRLDLDGFSSLWANSDEVIGDWLVTVERAPNPIAQYMLQESVSITVLEDEGEIVACMGWSTLNTIVGKEPLTVLLAHSLRVLRERRREGLGEIIRSFPPRALLRSCHGQFMFMRQGNVGVEGFLNGVGFRAGVDRPSSEAVVTYFEPTKLMSQTRGIRPARPEDLPACADLINRTYAGLDLFSPVTAQSLGQALHEQYWGERLPETPPVYGWSDFYVYEQAGRIVACAGLWDRGRDIRERWTSRVTGESRMFDYTALLDLGYATGDHESLATLIRYFADKTLDLGRTAMAAPLQHLAPVASALSDLPGRQEGRILEWSRFAPSAPPTLRNAHIDLRYW